MLHNHSSVEHMRRFKCFLSFPQYSNNPVYRRIYEQMERKKSYASSMEEGVRRTLERNYVFIGEAVSLDLAAARYCKLIRSQEVVAMRAYAIAAPRGELLEPVRMFRRCLRSYVVFLVGTNHSSGHLDMFRIKACMF